FDRPQVIRAVTGGSTGSIHDRNLANARRHLLEQLQPFTCHGSWSIRKASGIAPRASHADDKAIAHWIGNEQEYDWFCAGLVKESSGSLGAATNNDIRPQSNKLHCCSSQRAKIARRPTFINLYATA